MQSAGPFKEATMSRITRRHLCFGIAVVFVVAAVIVPAASANFGPKDPWFEYGVSLTKQRSEQSVKAHTSSGVEKTLPWYAYDQALRAQKQRSEQGVKPQSTGVEKTLPWYAYDQALRKAGQKRSEQSVGIRIITDTLGSRSHIATRTPQAKVGTGSLEGSAIPNQAQ
jgi:hypothetical protein